MAARTGRFRTVGAFRSVFANADLRRVELAFLLFEMAKWGTRVAILVVAYEHGGATETGLVAAILLIPAALARICRADGGGRGGGRGAVPGGSDRPRLRAGRRRGRERDVDTAGAVGALPSAGPINRRARGGERRGRDDLRRDGAGGSGGIRSAGRAGRSGAGVERVCRAAPGCDAPRGSSSPRASSGAEP